MGGGGGPVGAPHCDLNKGRASTPVCLGSPHFTHPPWFPSSFPARQAPQPGTRRNLRPWACYHRARTIDAWLPFTQPVSFTCSLLGETEPDICVCVMATLAEWGQPPKNHWPPCCSVTPSLCVQLGLLDSVSSSVIWSRPWHLF